MSRKAKVTGRVLSQRALAENVFDLKIQTDLADEAGAGQFVGVYPKDKSTLLPRPISICEVNGREKPSSGVQDRRKGDKGIFFLSGRG